MAILQINLPDEIIESLKAQTEASGAPSVDEYLAGLIDPNYPVPITREREAELLKSLRGKGELATPEYWNKLKAEIRASLVQPVGS